MSCTVARADVGVFGGSGFYTLGAAAEQVVIETPYGPTSAKVAIAEMNGKRVAFLPRHGTEHQYLPAQVPYRANLWAMKELGVKHIIAPCSVGSLQPHIKPGSFVICDQFVDRTSGREDTFFKGPIATHISMADPYCPKLRAQATQAARDLGIEVHDRGTMVVIQGPRFSTRAESQWFQKMGWAVVNMTGYPECSLARELDMCYVSVALITDYDAGTEGVTEPVTMEEVFRVFNENNDKVRQLIMELVKRIDLHEDCSCRHTVEKSR